MLLYVIGTLDSGGYVTDVRVNEEYQESGREIAVCSCTRIEDAIEIASRVRASILINQKVRPIPISGVVSTFYLLSS